MRENALAFLAQLACGDADVVDVPLSAPVLGAAVTLVQRLDRALPGLTPPTVAAGPDGSVGFSWGDGRVHVHLSVTASGTTDAFREDLSTHALWEGPGDDVSTLIGLLRRFADGPATSGA